MIGLLFAGFALVGAAVVVGSPKKKGGDPPPPTPADRGYDLPECADLVITDPSKALGFAAGVGQLAPTISAIQKVLTLGCTVTDELRAKLLQDPIKIRFYYDMTRTAFGAYVAAGGVQKVMRAKDANDHLQVFLAQVAIFGVDTSDWPKGLP